MILSGPIHPQFFKGQRLRLDPDLFLWFITLGVVIFFLYILFDFPLVKFLIAGTRASNYL